MRINKSPLLLVFALFIITTITGQAASDTIRVKTITFADITKRSGTWLFPSPQEYEKILLEYTLKCDPQTTQDKYPCGEWDYLTYIVLTDSSGMYDSTARQQVNYKVRNSTPDEFGYTTVPVPRKQRFTSTTISGSTPQFTYSSIGSADQSNTAVLKPNGGKAQYMFTATELSQAGIAAGQLNAIELTPLDSVGIVRLFTVKITQTTQTAVPQPLRSDGFTTVVRRDVTFGKNPLSIPFHTGFTWDGTSNIIIELSCLSSPLPVKLAAGATQVQGYTDDDSRKALRFISGDQVEIPSAAGALLSDAITVSFWAFGSAQDLPRNHNVFEAYNAQKQRVVNIHLPWSDGTVYWDAGRTGGADPDRISKAIPKPELTGKWRHWAFVKDARAGTMKVYLDGELAFEGNGKTQKLNGITSILVGSGASGSYPGMLDEIQIWNTALDQQTVKAWMTRRLDAQHPKFQNLIAYYDCESQLPDGRLKDGSDQGNHATMFGMPVVEQLTSNDIGYLTRLSAARPRVGFSSGQVSVTPKREDFNVDLAPRVSQVILFQNPVQPRIYRPEDPDYPASPTDTLSVFAAGLQYIIDEDGFVVDSLMVTPQQTLVKDVKTYYDPVVDFELGRYITPYGIGLDLGPNGFKWIYDVTDFAPLLHDNVTLSAGNQQELLDMTFVMIKGLPARDVVQIDQLWYDRNAQFTKVLTNESLAPRSVTLHPDATTYKIKAVASGHEFSNPTNCAEFCPRDHFISVDNQERFTWQLWKECGDNPVYPQGGTWLIDRTGWCPGAPVDLYEFDLSPFAAGKKDIVVDYGIKPDTTAENWGRWEVSAQLIGYGPASSTIDAEIVDIISPNTWEFYSRMNPICGNPVIVIRNRGSKPLETLEITMSSDGNKIGTYSWTGNLAFMQTDTVTLPQPTWPTTEGEHMFTVELRTAEADGYGNNNHKTVPYVLPDVLYSDLEIALRTNKYANEQFEWELRKIGGDVIRKGSNLESEKTYTDTFQLEDGCYEYQLINKLGYGLDFWFLRDQLGTGSLQFKSQGQTIRNFKADFGNRVWIQFIVAAKPTIATNVDTLYFNAPSPQLIDRELVITPATSAPLRIDSINIRDTRDYYSIVSTSANLPVVLNATDSLRVVVRFNRPDAGTSTGSARVYSNDERMPIKIVRLIGNTAATSVDDHGLNNLSVPMYVFPNPAGAGSRLTLTSTGIRQGQATMSISDIMGNQIYRGSQLVTEAETIYFNLPPGISTGLFSITCEQNGIRRHTWISLVQ